LQCDAQYCTQTRTAGRKGIILKRVAVTGIGAVTPIGNTADEFISALFEGKNGISEITYFDTSAMKVKLAAELKGFDPLLYMDKQTANRTDIFTQYAIAASSQAAEQSGIVGNIASERFGVYFGSGIGGFQTLCSEHDNLREKGPRRVSPMFISKMIYNIAAGNIAIRFGAKGPCVAVSTACATGTTAIGEAYRAILHGYTDAAICGGSEASINEFAVAGFAACQTLSTSTDINEASLPFDSRRGGFVMGEGAATLVLEDYDRAVGRGAKILAEVVGYGSTCDAYHVTAPSEDTSSSSAAINQAREAIMDIPADRIYYNAHGTGTALNDKVETAAVKAAFGEDAYKLHISSTKSMTGHMLGATGAAEAIAAIAAMNNNLVPPTINLKSQDELCDLNCTPNNAVSCELDAALSMSLGFGGHNACIAFKKVK